MEQLCIFNSLMIIFQSLGIDILLVSSFYKKKKLRKILWGRYLGICFIWKHLFLIIHFIVIYLLIPLNEQFSKVSITFLIVSPAYFFNITNNFVSRFLILSKEVKTIFIISIISSIIGGIVNYHCIVNLSLGYVGWFFSAFIVSALMFIPQSYILYYKQRIFPNFKMKRKWLVQSLKKSLHAIPHFYSNFLLDSSDRVVMKTLNVDYINLANYNIAYYFGNLVNRGVMSIGMVLNPYILEYHKFNTKKHELLARNLMFYSLFSIICLVFSLTIFTNEIIIFVFNDLYNEDIVELSIIIIMAYNFRAMFWFSTNKLFLYEKVEGLWKISTIGGILNILMNIVLIPIYGYKLAAYTTFLSMAYFGLSGFYLNEYKKFKNLNFYPILWFILIVLMTGLSLLLKGSSVFLKVAIIFILILVNIFFLINKNSSMKILMKH